MAEILDTPVDNLDYLLPDMDDEMERLSAKELTVGTMTQSSYAVVTEATSQHIGHANPVSSSSTSQAISSDHCYGLPYQDHNYGSMLSPALASRISHSRSSIGSNHHSQHLSSTPAHLQRTRLTVKPAGGSSSTAYPSLAGPPPLERNSCSDDENIVDPMLYATSQTSASSGFVSPILAPSSSGYKSLMTSQQQQQAPPSGGGITVCSSSALRPRIRRVVMEDASHTYASSSPSSTIEMSHVSFGGMKQQQVLQQQESLSSHFGASPISHTTSSSSTTPQKVAVFRRLAGAGNMAVQISGPGGHLGGATIGASPPNLVSTSTTGAPTFSGSIVGPGTGALLAPVIAITPNDTISPPPKRPGRPRGARIGGNHQPTQQQQQVRAPRQPRRKKISTPGAGGHTQISANSAMRQPGENEFSNDFDGRHQFGGVVAEMISSPSNHESLVAMNLSSPQHGAIGDTSVEEIGGNNGGSSGEVSQSIESVLQSVNSGALSLNNFLAAYSGGSEHAATTQQHDVTSAATATSAAAADADFAETYKSLYKRLFKQLGEEPDDEDMADFDKPVGASRHRETFNRFAAAAKRSSGGSPSVASAVGAALTAGHPYTSGERSTSSHFQSGAKENASPKSLETVGVNTDTDDESSTDEDEWAGQDYTTRCICQMNHNDDFMIQCDSCEVWQHCDCLGLLKKSVPEKYLCEQCDPRPLKFTKEEAQKVQMKKLQKRKRQKSGRKRLTSSTCSVGRGRPRKNTADSSGSGKKPLGGASRQRANIKSAMENDLNMYEKYLAIEVNEYTNEVMKAIRLSGDTIGANLLDRLPVPSPCLSMFVSKDRRGLVANATIPPDQPLIEFLGSVYSLNEFNGRTKDGRVIPFLLFFRSLPKGSGPEGLAPTDLCVDARLKGTDARFVRRSCQPNTQVKLVIKNEQLHLLLVSTEVIESATELTIPFDYDFRLCNYEVECACKSVNGWEQRSGECPVERYNAQLVPLASPAASSGVTPSTSAKKSVSISSGRPSGNNKSFSSAKRRSASGGSSASSAAAAAYAANIKKESKHQQRRPSSPKKKFGAHGIVKKTVGLRVKLKTKPHHAAGSSNKLNLSKTVTAVATKMTNRKKLKPVASADLTRRRSSAAADAEDEISEQPPTGVVVPPAQQPSGFLVKPKKETPTQLAVKEELPAVSPKPAASPKLSSRLLSSPSSSSSLKSPQKVDAGQRLGSSTDGDESMSHLSREEKKVQQLVEQIARMEEREKRKEEKKLARHHDDPKDVNKDQVSPETTKKSEQSKILQQKEQPKKRGRRPSINRSSIGANKAPAKKSLKRSTSDKDFGTDDLGTSTDDMQSPRSTTDLHSPRVSFSETPMAFNVSPVSPNSSAHFSSSEQRKASNVDVERNVAKKRWLRQAMSEESNTSGLVLPTSYEKTLLETDHIASSASAAPLSPQRPAPLKKRKLTTSSQNVESEISDDISTNYASNEEVSLSTTEAAQLLAFMQQQQQQPFDQDQDMSVMATSGESGFLMQQDTDVKYEEIVVAGTDETATSIAEPRQSREVVEEPESPESPVMIADDSTTSGVEEQHQQQLPPAASTRSHQPLHVSPPKPKQKVKVSIDEYKKRNRNKNSTDVAPDFQHEASSRDSTETFSAPTTAAAIISNLVQRQSSFFPQIKPGELDTKNLRLGSLPDPRLIGKPSATMEELRQRIYGRSYTKESSSHQQQQTVETNGPTSASTHRVVESSVTIATNDTHSSGQPITSAQQAIDRLMESSSTQSATQQQRMSLMDRLRIEFGLDEPTAGANSNINNNAVEHQVAELSSNVRQQMQQQQQLSAAFPATGGFHPMLPRQPQQQASQQQFNFVNAAASVAAAMLPNVIRNVFQQVMPQQQQQRQQGPPPNSNNGNFSTRPSASNMAAPPKNVRHHYDGYFE